MSRARPATARWWSKGVRFECQGTGRCCTGRDDYRYVYVTAADRHRLAKFFEIETSSYTQLCCEREEGGRYHLRDFTAACRYLNEARCTVYAARPTQCRTWPFWPENMSVEVWRRNVVPCCAGIGKGKLYTEEEIQELLDQERLAQLE